MADAAPAPTAAAAAAGRSSASPPSKRTKTDTTTPATVTDDGASAVAPAPALQVKKLSDHAQLPTRGSAFAAGYDLYAARETAVPARGKVLVDTDISIAVPAGTSYAPALTPPPPFPSRPLFSRTDGRIAPRSGLAAKNFIDTGAGVIDADYRGPLKVLLFNHADVDYDIKKGDRIAQLVLERIVTPDVVEVPELEQSVRGAGGFGSTGKQ